MKHVMAIDQGTSSCRAIVLGADGAIKGLAQREFTQHFPRPGWVEHDPEEIWTTQADVMREVLKNIGLKRDEIAAIGITNQRETTVVWDRKTGIPICRAIVWQDRRTGDVCERLNARGRGPWFHAKTGLVVDPYFSGTKVQWILDNVDGARAKAEAGDLVFGTIDTWLIHRMTGGRLHITDESNASRTLLWNIHTGDWDDEILELLRIPRSLLPEVHSSSEVYGEITDPTELRGVPIAGILGDQQAATMGQMCVEPGMAKNTYGTGCFLLLNTGAQATDSKSNLLTTVAWSRASARTYALEGSVFVAGAVVQWLRDALGIISSAREIEPLAAGVEDSGGLIFVPALAGLGAPHWDPRARGTVIGISRATTKAHLARAALEGIAFEVADLVRAMEADCGAAMSELRVDGGAAANDLLMQIQADMLQFPVVRPTSLETTALGAAYMAGLATGVWRSVEEIQANWQIDRVFEPIISRDEADARQEKWRRAVDRARGWVKD